MSICKRVSQTFNRRRLQIYKFYIYVVKYHKIYSDVPNRNRKGLFRAQHQVGFLLCVYTKKGSYAIYI